MTDAPGSADTVATDQPSPAAVLRSLMLPIMVPTLVYAIGTAAIIPVIPLVGLQLGLSVPQVALLSTLTGVVTMLGPIPTGQLMSRIGERLGLILGGALAVVALVGCLWSASQPGRSTPGGATAVFVVSLVVLAAGDLTWDLGRQTYLADHVPHYARARVMTTFGGGLRVGRVVGPAIGALVLSLTDIQTVFVVHLIACGLSILSVIVFVTPAAQPTQAPITELTAPTPAERRTILRPFVLIGTSITVLVAVRTNRDLLIPLLGHHFGYSPQAISVVFAISAVVEIALVVPAGTIMQRHGRLAVLLPCLFGTGVAFLLSPVAGSLAGFLAVGLVLAAGNGLGAGINKTLSADLTPSRHRASWMGWWNAMVGAGALIGPGLVAVCTAAGSVVTGGIATGVLALLGGFWARHWGRRFLRR